MIDLDHEIILSATVHHGTEGDAGTLMESVVNAQRNLILAGSAEEIQEVVADKGYHKNETITQATQFGMRTYIPEPNSPHDRVWTDKPEEVKQAVVNNRRRMKRDKGKALQRERSEKVERSFAHVCETGGAGRTWLRGLEKISKRYLIVAAARNLSLLMRKAFGIGKPRCLQAGLEGLLAGFLACLMALQTLWIVLSGQVQPGTAPSGLPDKIHQKNRPSQNSRPPHQQEPKINLISTDC